MRIRTRTIILTLSNGLSQATTLLLGILLVRIVSKEVLGTYRQVFLTYTFLAGVLSLQLENSLFYFLPKVEDLKRKTLLLQTGLLSLGPALLIGIVMYFGAPLIADFMGNPSLVPLIRIMALFGLPQAINVLVPAFLVSVDRAVGSAVFTLLQNAGRIAITVALFAMDYNLEWVMWGGVVFTAAMAVAGAAMMSRRASAGPMTFDRRLLLEQLHYCWPLWITVVIGTAMVNFDKLLISNFFSTAQFAEYTNGAFELPVIGLVTSSLSVAMMPNLVTLADQGRRLDALELWQEGARKCSLVIFPCFALFLAIGPELMSLMWGSKYAIPTWPYTMSAWPFVIYLFLLPTRIVIFGSLFRALGQTKPYAISALYGLIADVAFGTTITWAGGGGFLSFIGPALGVICTGAVMFCYSLLKMSQIMGIPVSGMMRWKELGRTLLLCAGCGAFVFGLGLVPYPMPLAVKLATETAVFAVLLVGVFLATKQLKNDEKQMLLSPLRTLGLVRPKPVQPSPKEAEVNQP